MLLEIILCLIRVLDTRHHLRNVLPAVNICGSADALSCSFEQNSTTSGLGLTSSHLFGVRLKSFYLHNDSNPAVSFSIVWL